MSLKRLDRVVALRSTKYLTEGKTYTVLGVKASGSLVLIATDKKERRYLRSNSFMLESKFYDREDEEQQKRLEERGF